MMTTATFPATPSDLGVSDVERLFSLKELTALGYGAEPTLRKYIREGRVPVIRFGRTIKVRASDLKLFEAPPKVTESEADQHIRRLEWAAKTLTGAQVARLQAVIDEAS